jgi:pimeloyl-ACP methyl ester carboxylesterase
MTMTAKLVRWIAALTISGLMMAAVLAGAAKAQEAAGDWNGRIHLPTGDHRIAVEITGAPGAGYAGRVESPDVRGTGTALDEVRVADGRLTFSVPSIHATYQGRWDAAASAWVGEWTQGAVFPLTLAKGLLPPGPVVTGLDGDWQGVVVGPVAKLRIVLHVRTGRFGTTALMDSPDQLAYGIVLEQLARGGDKVSFRQSAIHGAYTGVLSADGNTIAGAWTQGASTPLVFTKTTGEPAVARRPQTPVKPYPYREEEVAFDSAPGVRLAGTLTLPPGKGPFPAAVLITGSGAQDRDETLLGHKPFLVIADRLTRDGIAVLRYDDRGFGKSTGEFAKALTTDFAVDAAAGVAFLRKRSDIDAARVGLIGHSEGGLVAPMVAAKDHNLGFVVLLAGPGAPLSEVLAAQRLALGPGMGIGPKALAASQTVMDHAVAAMRGAKDDAEAEARVAAVLTAEGAPLGISPAVAAAQAKQLSSGWMRGLLTYDPRPTLAQVRAPILAVNGSKDLQVPMKQNLDGIRAATKANRDVTIVELPGLNHLLQTAPTGAVGEYADIEETVAPIALDTISGWIVKHTRRP